MITANTTMIPCENTITHGNNDAISLSQRLSAAHAQLLSRAKNTVKLFYGRRTAYTKYGTMGLLERRMIHVLQKSVARRHMWWVSTMTGQLLHGRNNYASLKF